MPSDKSSMIGSRIRNHGVDTLGPVTAGPAGCHTAGAGWAGRLARAAAAARLLPVRGLGACQTRVKSALLKEDTTTGTVAESVAGTVGLRCRAVPRTASGQTVLDPKVHCHTSISGLQCSAQ